MKKETEFEKAITPLKPALDAFGQEVERVVAASAVPPLPYFQALVAGAQRKARRRALLESLLFPVVALVYLAGVGFLLRQGYTVPFMIFYAGVSLFLPFVIFFAQPGEERGPDQG